MFNSEDGFNGGVENGIYYLERIIALIKRIIDMLFGGKTSETTEAVSE